jgi:hypothetical protein
MVRFLADASLNHDIVAACLRWRGEVRILKWRRKILNL